MVKCKFCNKEHTNISMVKVAGSKRCGYIYIPLCLVGKKIKYKVIKDSRT